ncbi:hypothetical protein HK098_000998, partial [Nowakowskiella sp. JEL0407]
PKDPKPTVEIVNEDSDESDGGNDEVEVLEVGTVNRSLEEFERVCQYLVDPGPAIVVADEGHLLKNAASQRSKAVASIHTPTKILLTGTPLQNNLIEYWNMINLVFPGYLGDQNDFRIKFERPINDGRFNESQHHEIINSLKKLRILTEIIRPIAKRRTIEDIKHALPNKVDYLIQCPLTFIQHKMYSVG